MSFSIVYQSTNCILWDSKPEEKQLKANLLAWKSKEKIDQLINELSANGPFFVEGQFGSSAYKEEPFKTKTVLGNREIFGWKPGAEKIPTTTRVIIIGAMQEEGKEYVFFADPKKDKFVNRFFKRIYMISYKNFCSSVEGHSNANDNKKNDDQKEGMSASAALYQADAGYRQFLNMILDDMGNNKEQIPYPLVPSPKVSLSNEEAQEYVKKLSEIPLSTIFNTNRKMCYALGQEIFDHFKKEDGGKTSAGQKAVVTICDSLKLLAKDGHLRSQYIEKAWDGIGDDEWQWMG